MLHNVKTCRDRRLPVLCALLAGVTGVPALAGGGGGGWINLNDETATRLIAASDIGDLDVEEKDYAWGDVDQDGDIDLVCVRKQPFTSTGGRRNVLFMNEGIADGHAFDGILVDRTVDFVADSDTSGQSDFMDTTNDRDVVLVDVDGDTWLDIVTATTLSDGLAKTISHPRVYMNMGESGGNWLGFEYDESRIPHIESAEDPATPRFCSVAAGDLTGDGAPDLYFGDYDSGGGQLFDFNNRLLINDGDGNFTDETDARLTNDMRLSAFGAASVIADINGDNVNDVVKQTSLNAPQHIAVTYNDSGTPGSFVAHEIKYSLAPYFVSADDLNGDGMMDLVVTDDDTDAYMLNNGSVGGVAQFTTYPLPEIAPNFGGNSVIADLDNDGNNDIIITDVDVDISGCTRLTQFYRNNCDAPLVTFSNESDMLDASMRNGVHDVAVFDINNDGWLDIVMGRCDGMDILMQVPPPAIVFDYPNGLPGVAEPGQAEPVTVEMRTSIDDPVDLAASRMHYSVDGGPFETAPLTELGCGLFEVMLPAAVCGSQIEFYFEAMTESGGETFFSPAGAPATRFTVDAAELTETLRDEIEGKVDTWTITSDPGLTTGGWEAAEPIGTITGAQLAAPDADHTPTGVAAFITQNGLPGGGPGDADIDNGATTLLSPVIDLSGEDNAEISFARWFFTTAAPGEDYLRIEISDDDGANWALVDEVTTTLGDSGTEWEHFVIPVGSFVSFTDQVRVRFTAADAGGGTIVEAGIDDFVVTAIGCDFCPADINSSGHVDVTDLLAVLSAWGACPAPCPEDTDNSGAVDVTDLLTVLSNWGPCP